MTPPADRKLLLTVLWIFVLFNYIYADLLMMIVNPTLYQRAAARMTSGAVLGFAVLMEILIAMVLLASLLPYRANRWANIIGALVGTAFVAVTLRGSAPLYYLFFSTLEIACTLAIGWYAWTWRIPDGAH
jgi:hypothetical protein